MRLKPILLFVTSAVFLVAMSGCGGDNKTSDILGSTPTAVPSSDTPVPIVTMTQSTDSAAMPNQNTFDSKGYDLACSDRVLGAAISDSIFHRDGIPSTDEIKKLEECRYGTLPSSTNPQNQPSDQLTTVHGNDRSKGQNNEGGGDERKNPQNQPSDQLTTVHGNDRSKGQNNEGGGDERKNPQNQPSDQLTTVHDNDRSKGQNNEGGGNQRSELANWRELYQIPYRTSCMDDRLGIDVVSKFQDGVRGPTEAEFGIIESCDIERADLLADGDSRKDSPDRGDGQDDSRRAPSDKEEYSIEEVRERIENLKAVSGTWIRTGERTNDQFVLGYIPNPDEWRCGVAEVGADILRAIKAGKHTITDEENQKLTPCFRAPPEELTHPLTQFNCIPLDILLEFVDYYRPSWEQLECHLVGLERYEMPQQIRSSGVGDAFGVRNMKGPLYPPLWDKVWNNPDFAEFKLNWSPATVNMGMPPSYDEEYNSMKCPQANLDSTGKYQLGEYWLSEEIRGAAIGYIIEKKKGRRIYADLDMCTNAYIVQGNLEDYEIHINSVQDFKDMALNVAIPAYAMKAKAAEKVKAELMQLNAFGNSEQEVPFSFHEALYNLPPAEQVELAQWYLDLTIAEVRKYYNGTVWVASAGRYDTRHPDFPASGLNPSFGPHWKNLSFAAADHVSFTIDGICSFDHMKRFFNDQFEGYMEIVERDNVTYHIIGSVVPDKFSSTFIKGCSDEYEERKIEIHTWLLSKYDELPIEPLFLYGVPSHPRSWVKDEEGWYPTAENADRGDWKLFNIDAQQPDPEVQELYADYARSHIIEE